MSAGADKVSNKLDLLIAVNLRIEKLLGKKKEEKDDSNEAEKSNDINDIGKALASISVSMGELVISGKETNSKLDGALSILSNINKSIEKSAAESTLDFNRAVLSTDIVANVLRGMWEDNNRVLLSIEDIIKRQVIEKEQKNEKLDTLSPAELQALGSFANAMAPLIVELKKINDLDPNAGLKVTQVIKNIVEDLTSVTDIKDLNFIEKINVISSSAASFLENLAKGQPFVKDAKIVAPELVAGIKYILQELGNVSDVKDKGFLITADLIAKGAASFLENLSKAQPFVKDAKTAALELVTGMKYILQELNNVTDIKDKGFLITADAIASGVASFLENLAKGQPFVKDAKIVAPELVAGIKYILQELNNVTDIKDKGFLNTADVIAKGAADFLENLAKGQPFVKDAKTTVPELVAGIKYILQELNNVTDIKDKGFLNTVDNIAKGAASFLENLSKAQPFVKDAKIVVPELVAGIKYMLRELSDVTDIKDKGFLITADVIAKGAADFLENLSNAQPFVKDAKTTALELVAGIKYMLRDLSDVTDIKDKGFLITVNDIAKGAASFLENLSKAQPFVKDAKTAALELVAGIKYILQELNNVDDVKDKGFLNTADVISKGAADFLENLSNGKVFAKDTMLVVPELVAGIKYMLRELSNVTDIKDKGFLITADVIAKGAASFLENLSKAQPFVKDAKIVAPELVAGIKYILRELSDVTDIKDKGFLNTVDIISKGAATFLENLSKGKAFAEDAKATAPDLVAGIKYMLRELSDVTDIKDKGFLITADVIAKGAAAFLENLSKAQPFVKDAKIVAPELVAGIKYILRELSDVTDIKDKGFLNTVDIISKGAATFLENLSKGKAFAEDAKATAPDLVAGIKYMLRELSDVTDIKDKGFLNTADSIGKLSGIFLENLAKGQPFVKDAKTTALELVAGIKYILQELGNVTDIKDKGFLITADDIASGTASFLENLAKGQPFAASAKQTTIALVDVIRYMISELGSIGSFPDREIMDSMINLGAKSAMFFEQLANSEKYIEPSKLVVRSISEIITELDLVLKANPEVSSLLVLADKIGAFFEKIQGAEESSRVSADIAKKIGEIIQSITDPLKVLDSINFDKIADVGNKVQALLKNFAGAEKYTKDAKKGALAVAEVITILIEPLKSLNATGDDISIKIDGLLSIGEKSIGFMKALADADEYADAAKTGAESVAEVINVLIEQLQESMNNIDPANLEKITNFLDVLSQGAGKFMKDMALFAIIGPVAALGTLFFGLTVNMLVGILSKSAELKEETTNGIAAVMDISNGAIKFGLAMSLWAIIGPIAAVGALMFSIVVLGMTKILSMASTLNEETTNGIAAILNMAKGAALFGLAMIFYAFAGPMIAMGALVFVTVVGAMLLVFGLLGVFNKSGGMQAAAETLDKMKYSAALLALTFVLISFVAVPFAKGALVFTAVVGVMLLVFGLLGTFFPAMTVAARTINMMAKGVAILSLTFLVVGFFAAKVALGALVTVLTIGALLLVMGLVAKNFGQLMVAARAIDKIAKPIAILMATFVVVGFFAKQAIVGALASSLAITVMGGALFLLGKLDTDGGVTRGAGVLQKLGFSLAIFVGSLLVLSFIKDWKNVGIGLAVIAGSIIVLGAAAAFLGNAVVAPIVLTGAGVLIALGAALVVFAVALMIFSKINITKKWADDMKYALIKIGEAVASMGSMSIGIVLGAASLIILGPALIVFSLGLLMFKATKFTKQDGESLKTAINGVVSAFSSVGLLDSAKASAVGALVTMMGVGLTSLSIGLTAFKKVGYTENDGELMKNAISSIVSAFSDAFNDLTPTKWMQIQAGISLISQMGGAISSLALGVSKMANLEVVEYEVVGKGTKNAKLVPKGNPVKLKKEDFTAAATNVKEIISALQQPLLDFGVAAKTGKGEGFFSFFNASDMEAGLDMLVKLSSSLGSLGEGVAKMANLEVVTTKVIAPGTKNAKIVPDKTIKLKSTDFAAAGANVGLILSAVSGPLTTFGKAIMGVSPNDEGFEQLGKKFTSMFIGGYIEKGLEGLSKLSGSLGNLGEGVLKMAKLEFVEMGVVGTGKNAKVVPKKVTKLDDTHFTAAGFNIGKLLGALSGPLSDFGKAMSGVDPKDSLLKGMFKSIFSGDYINKGLDGLAKLTQPLNSLADLIIKLGSGNFVEQKLEKGKLVPGKVLKISDVLATAKTTIADILAFVPDQFKTFGEKWEKMADTVEAGISGLEVVSKGMSLLSDITSNYFKATEAVMDARKKFKDLAALEKAGRYPFLMPALQVVRGAEALQSKKEVLTNLLGILENTVSPIMRIFSNIADDYKTANNNFQSNNRC